MASVRDYIVKGVYNSKEDLIIECAGQQMTIPNDKLMEGRFSKDVFISKHDNRPYQLVDYKWQPDQQKQQTLYG